MQIFAHRGAKAVAPENTLLAMERALQQEADGIEIDVHQHGEEFVIIHDRWVHRTTNGMGLLQELTLMELRALDAGEGQRIPLLSEVLLLIGDKCTINLELKSVTDPALLLAYCHQYQHSNAKIIYSSFNHVLLAQLKKLSPQLTIGALTASKPLSLALFAQELGAMSVNIDVAFVDQEMVDDAKLRNLEVWVFTVDFKQDIKMLAEWGVDGIFANHPRQARVLLEQLGD